MGLWTMSEAVAATGGTCAVDWQANGVSIDTRTLQSGDLFVALSAARDGHDFVAQALKQGASAALVSRVPDDVPADAPLLIVPDVLNALCDLARAARTRSDARVVAVTGSVGKTSTKDMLQTALAGQGATHAAEASYNNHWGVPLTLARMPRDTQFAVIEIGMSAPGEIAPLARLARPHVVMITTVAAAHLATFENVEGIAHEKASICDGLEPGGVAVLNADLAQSGILTDTALRQGAKVITFGESPHADYKLDDVAVHADTTVGQIHAGGATMFMKIGSPGRHFAVNATGVTACVQALNADCARALIDLAGWSVPSGRGLAQTIFVGNNRSFELLDDAFNANPTSMAAAFEVLVNRTFAVADDTDRPGKHGRKVAVLGDMLELGSDEIAMHKALADDPSFARIDIVHTVGPRMRHLHDILPEHQRGIAAPDPQSFMAQLGRLIEHSDIVLVKGSKGSQVSLISQALKSLSR